MPDSIHIEGLELSACIGVPDEERAAPQRLTVSLVLEPIRDFRALEDRIGNTVDYFALARTVQALAMVRPRQLIETLAEEIAATVLDQFAVRSIQVELRKYILPDTAFVAIRIERGR